MTLTEFLLARIAEDEAALLNGWDSDGKARVASMWTGDGLGHTTVASDQGDGVWFADGREIEDARHVQVLFNPARELAECRARRMIVEPHKSGGGEYGDGYDAAIEDVLTLLALPYADHPDHDESWKH